jgi:hypothetical protein
MIDRFLSLVMAVSLALLIWLYTRSREQEPLDNVPIPVELVLSAKQAELYTLEVTGARQVMVSFTGPPQRIRELHMMLQRKELQVVKTITVPDERLNESRYSDAAILDGADIHAPPGVTTIVHEGHNRISYTLHRLVERRLPVRFDALREGHTGPIILDPATVLVRGPREVLDRVQAIPTQPSELPARPMNAPINVAAIGRVPLVEELEGRPVRVTPPRVTVRVPGKGRKLFELNDVQVQFLCPPNFPYRPAFIDERSGKVTLRLLGPSQEEPPKIHAFIDLGKGKFVSGLNHEPLQIQLPKDYQFAQEPPRVVAFQLHPADFVPEGLGLPAPPASPPPD